MPARGKDEGLKCWGWGWGHPKARQAWPAPPLRFLVIHSETGFDWQGDNGQSVPSHSSAHPWPDSEQGGWKDRRPTRESP